MCKKPVKMYFERLVEKTTRLPKVFFEKCGEADHSGPDYLLAPGCRPFDHGFSRVSIPKLGSLKEERGWDHSGTDVKRITTEGLLSPAQDRGGALIV